MKVLFDTGSSIIWLNSTDCRKPNCLQSSRFAPEQSNTFFDLKEELKMAFKAGIVSGIQSEDDFYFKQLKLQRQVFMRVTEFSNDIFRDFDGIIGLSLEGLSQKNVKTFLENLLEQKLLEHNLFSFRLDNINNTQAAAVDFGSIDKSLYTGPITYSPVVSEKYWQVIIEKILLEGKETEVCHKGCLGIFDSGSSLISGPPRDVQTLSRILKIDLSCRNLEKLPKITFVI